MDSFFLIIILIESFIIGYLIGENKGKKTRKVPVFTYEPEPHFLNDNKGIVAFAFGTPHDIKPNWRLAQIAKDNALEHKAPVYTQTDIFIDHPEVDVEYIDEEPGSPPPTLRIARGAVQWAKRKGIREILVAAATPHLWRCLRDLKHAVRESGESIEIKLCSEIEQLLEDWWFSPESTQKRVRSKKDWWSRERILKWMPMFLYKKIAK